MRVQQIISTSKSAFQEEVKPGIYYFLINNYIKKIIIKMYKPICAGT